MLINITIFDVVIIYSSIFFHVLQFYSLESKVYTVNFMEAYNIRVENAKNDFMHMDGTLWENIERLWKMGYSLRVISEITGITRSKLQRHLSESNAGREDDVRTQNRDNRVLQTKKLLANGCSNAEIAKILCLNVRTIESYIKQLNNREE